MSSEARGDTALGSLNFFIDDKRVPLTEHKTEAIAAEVGRTYQVLASDAGMDDAQSPLAKDVVVLREGQGYRMRVRSAVLVRALLQQKLSSRRLGWL
tara:strand:+ start:307 stop:597 length:291 start_codon:yes stop_codon:yes gene_type:complete